jgi:PAS domain S-box-containing protein
LNQKLKENIEKIEAYVTLFTLSRDLIAIADFNGHFILVNPAWEHTLGFTIEELLDKPFLDFVHPDDKEKTLKAAQKLGEGEVEIVEFVNRYQTKDGEYRWLSWNAKSSTDHKKTYNIARDITDREQATE